MNDKELADKVVAHGVGELHIRNFMLDDFDMSLEPSKFVRDWRVAGALMEKEWGFLERLIALSQIDFIPKNESLPRAIIEAYVEAQERT